MASQRLEMDECSISSYGERQMQDNKGSQSSSGKGRCTRNSSKAQRE